MSNETSGQRARARASAAGLGFLVIALAPIVADSPSDSPIVSSLPVAPTTTTTVEGKASPAIHDAALASAQTSPFHMDVINPGSTIGWNAACEEGGAPCAIGFAASDDGGKTWEARGTIDWSGHGHLSPARRGVFISPTVGWFLAGSSLWATIDGARSWSSVNASWVTALAAGPFDEAWAVGSCDRDEDPCLRAGILREGSSTVIPKVLPRANDGAVRGQASESGAALAVVVATVADGPWVFDVIPPCGPFKGPPQIVAIDRAQAWLTCRGEPGGGQGPQEIHRSTDGGRVWSLVADNACCGPREPAVGSLGAEQLHRIFPSPSGVLLGSSKYGSIYRSTDGGASWEIVSRLSGGPGMQIEWADGKSAYAWTLNELQVTRDAGTTWEVVRTFGP